MKKHLRYVQLAALLAVSALVAYHAPAQAADPPPDKQKIFDKLIGAIKANDRDAFVADATDAVKEGTTQQIMDDLNKELGSRFTKGYQATYLCQLKQEEYQVHLWKVTFQDKGDDVVIRIALKDGKVAGFVLR